jgi:hypothetical protein
LGAHYLLATENVREIGSHRLPLLVGHGSERPVEAAPESTEVRIELPGIQRLIDIVESRQGVEGIAKQGAAAAPAGEEQNVFKLTRYVYARDLKAEANELPKCLKHGSFPWGLDTTFAGPDVLA